MVFNWFNIYNYIGYIDALELTCTDVNLPKELQLKNVNKLKVPSNMTNIAILKKNFNDKLLPLTTNLKYYGELLLLDDRSKAIKKILNQKFKEQISESDSLFLYENAKRNNSIKNKKVLILSKSFKKFSFRKMIYY